MPKTKPAPTPLPPEVEVPEAAAPPTPAGSAAEFARFLPDATSLADHEIHPMQADVALALANCARGLEAVLAFKARLQAELPSLSLSEIESLADLGLALAYASGQVDRYAPPPALIREMLKRAAHLRSLLLGSADMLVLAKVLTANSVSRIHQSRGPIQLAGDCTALADLFTTHRDAIAGKTPVTSVSGH